MMTEGDPPHITERRTAEDAILTPAPDNGPLSPDRIARGYDGVPAPANTFPDAM